MPQSCTICRQRDRPAIDAALIENEPLRNIAKQYGVTSTSLHRHRQHLPRHLLNAKQAQEATESTSLLDRVEKLIHRLDRIATRAEKDRAWSSAAGAIRETRGCLTLLARMRGELEQTEVKIDVAFQCVEANLLSASPTEFGQFWRTLLEKASDEQVISAADEASKKAGVIAWDLSVLSDDELQILERISAKIQRPSKT
jgi:hypothetical protein